MFIEYYDKIGGILVDKLEFIGGIHYENIHFFTVHCWCNCITNIFV